MHVYQHKMPTHPHNAPHKWELPDYGAKTQWVANESNKPIIPPEYSKYVQNLVVKFLHYARSVEPTMLVALEILGLFQISEVNFPLFLEKKIVPNDEN